MKLVRLMQICLNESSSKIHIGHPLSDTFPVQNSLKQGDALSPLLFNFALEYAIRKSPHPKKKQVGLKLNRTLQLLVYADDDNLQEDNMNAINKITETLNRR
jgi:hypothetical protein